MFHVLSLPMFSQAGKYQVTFPMKTKHNFFASEGTSGQRQCMRQTVLVKFLVAGMVRNRQLGELIRFTYCPRKKSVAATQPPRMSGISRNPLIFLRPRYTTHCFRSLLPILRLCCSYEFFARTVVAFAPLMPNSYSALYHSDQMKNEQNQHGSRHL